MPLSLYTFTIVMTTLLDITSVKFVVNSTIMMSNCRSQWPRGLRRGSAVARLLGLWVRIPPGHGVCLSVVSVVCCQVEVSATSWSLVQRSPTEYVVSQKCVIMKPRRNEEAQAHIGLSSHKKKS
jgi:hypothetical protein